MTFPRMLVPESTTAGTWDKKFVRGNYLSDGCPSAQYLNRQCGMPIRKCKQIKKALEKYYGGDYFRDDLALRTAVAAVQTLPPSFGRFIAEVCMIADWGSIPYFPFDVTIAMAAEIETCWLQLEAMRHLCTENWAVQTESIVSAVDALSHTRLLQPPTTTRNQLSFISKYLHFCVNDAFPIWDKNARTALGHRDDQATWTSYKTWLSKIRREVEDQRVGCLEQRRLPGESLVRTLDKALYVIGQRVLKRQAQLGERAKRQ